MRRYLLLPLIVVTVLLVSFIPPDNWTIFTSDLGHYAISFPGAPSEHSESDTTENDIPFAIHTMSYSEADTEIYVLGWIDMTKFYPKDKNIIQLLEEGKKGAVNSLQATNVNVLKTNLEGAAFTEFTFKTNGYIGKERVYIINKFQYSVIALKYQTMDISPNMDRFITSFSAPAMKSSSKKNLN